MATQAQILEQIQEMLAAILPQGAPRVTADLDRLQTRLDDQRRSFTGA